MQKSPSLLRAVPIPAALLAGCIVWLTWGRPKNDLASIPPPSPAAREASSPGHAHSEHSAQATAEPESQSPPSEVGAVPVDHPHLGRLFAAAPAVWVGGEPHDEEAFEELAKRGVKAIISVDGAQPNAAAAKAHGMRYIHVPIGYDGIPRYAALALARIAKEVPGPIYVHCHHGKHRGPAAAAVICQAQGLMDAAQANEFLHVAGTGENYTGLWRDVDQFTQPTPDDPLPDLPEMAHVAPLVDSMSALDRAMEELTTLRGSDFKELTDPQYTQATALATIVHEGFTEAARLGNAEEIANLLADLQQAESRSGDLLQAVTARDSAQAEGAFRWLKASCTNCHQQHRDH